MGNSPNLGVRASKRMSMTHQTTDALIDALRSEHVPDELFPHNGTAMAEAEALHVEPD
jgi:hypothetical protein